MGVIEITSASQFTDLTSIIGPTTLVAVYFHTPWAAPCIQMKSVFESLAESYPSTIFLSVNADNNTQVSELFDISSVPFFVLIKNGTIIKELSGGDTKELFSSIKHNSQACHSDSNSSHSSSHSSHSSHKHTRHTHHEGSRHSPRHRSPESYIEETPEALNERLTKLINAAPVMLFMKGNPSAPKCDLSRQMVALLREHRVRFGFFDIQKDDAVRQGLKAFSDWPTYPQLYINGQLQGGLDIIKDSIDKDPTYFDDAVNGP